MGKDPIVEEVRAIRDQLAARHEYDLEAILHALQLASQRNGRELGSLPDKPVSAEDAARRAG